MGKLSVCMITLNEENDLSKCLKSVKPFADEIIIVDTGSTDKTKGIAKQFGAKLFDFTWVDDFSAARNVSLDHATGDWILVIDADEIISKEDLKKIKFIIEKTDSDAFFLDQRNYTTNTKVHGWKPVDHYKECKGDGFFSNPIIRLFRNKKEIRFSNKIHEMVDKSLLKISAKVENSGIPIHHYGPLRSEEFINKKREKYLRIGLAQIKETPDNPRPYYEVAMIYKNTGKFEKAEEFFKKVAVLDERYLLVYTNLGEVYGKRGDLKRAVEAYRKSIELKPKNENAFINLSLIYTQKNKFNEAISLLVKALDNNPKSSTAYNNLALLMVKKKDYAKAVKILTTAHKRTGLAKFKAAKDALLKKQPEIIKQQEWYQSGDYKNLEKHFKAKLKKDPNDVMAATNLGLVYHKKKDFNDLSSFLSDFLKDKEPKGPLIINLFVNWASAEEGLGHPAKAKEILQKVIAHKPPMVEFLKKKLASIN